MIKELNLRDEIEMIDIIEKINEIIKIINDMKNDRHRVFKDN